MANSKRPRKQYRQKHIGLPVTIRFKKEDECTLQLVPHAELLKLKSGEADEQTWHTLIARLNVGMVVSNMREIAEGAKCARNGLDALLAVRERYRKTGKWGVSGDEALAIGDALVLTDDLQKTSTRRLLRDAMRYVFDHAAE